MRLFFVLSFILFLYSFHKAGEKNHIDKPTYVEFESMKLLPGYFAEDIWNGYLAFVLVTKFCERGKNLLGLVFLLTVHSQGQTFYPLLWQ